MSYGPDGYLAIFDATPALLRASRHCRDATARGWFNAPGSKQP
jgi:hypothetical protein